MTLIEFIDKYRGNEKLTVKEMTEFFNKLEPEDRLDFLSELEDSERKKFIKDIRQQAVKDFWWHERQAIMDGTCTRDWSPEQIEIIMNINEKNGKMSTNAAKGLVLDDEGGYIIDKKGNKSYYGHHMVDVSTHPEFAGEWRNIQALDYDEHYDGAHPKHDTKTPTVGYYDVETGDTEVIDVDAKKFSFEKHVKYPPKRPCVFQSNENMEKIYSNFGKLTDAEKLALKNVDLASRTGDIQRFNAGIDLAQRYNSTDFINKIGLKTDAEIKQMYGVLNNCNDPDIINQYRLYEYSTRHGYQMDAVIYVDKDGNILGTSLDKTYIPDSNDYQLSMTESTKCLSNTELKSHSNLVKVEDAKAEAAKEIGDADKGESADKDKEVEDTGKTEEGSKETEDKDKTEEGSKETGETDRGTDTDKGSEYG